MSLDDIFMSAQSALGLPEMVAMLLGGVMFGAFILWLNETISSGDTGVRYVMLIFVIAGLIFFISRGSALYFAQSTLWPRNIGFAILWVIYCLSMGVGLMLRRRATR